MIVEVGSLILGIVLLIVSGNYLVKGGVGLAKHFNISTLVVGLTVVAFGTSAPELIVCVNAALTGHPEIALGNVIGSNIANIALVLAATVILLPIPVGPATIKHSWPFMFLSGVLLYLSMIDGEINRIEGIMMVVLLLIFIIYSLKVFKKEKINVRLAVIPDAAQSPFKSIVFVVLASVGLALGSRLLINGASSIAQYAGISERVISLTIVAFGTSLPELTASVIAAIKKETGISVGNIIGSNLFNVFAVIGITSGIYPIVFSFPDFRFDLNFMIFFYILLLIFMLPISLWLTKRRKNVTFVSTFKELGIGKLSRVEGIILVTLYIVYVIMLF
jgi:cation:H+ antiporter